MSASPVIMAVPSGSDSSPHVRSVPARPAGAYRFGCRPVRAGALVATVMIHLAVGAVVAIGWPRTRTAIGAPHPVTVIVLPQPAQEPRRAPVSGTRAPVRQPEPLPVRSDPPPTILLVPPAPVAVEVAVAMPAPSDGGRVDVLQLETQAYRRAIVARLEAQRRPVRSEKADGGKAGAVLFRIERSGRLLDAAVAQSTGSRGLDRAALSLVRRAAPFPAIPDGLPDELAITLPVEFLLGPGVPGSGIAVR